MTLGAGPDSRALSLIAHSCSATSGCALARTYLILRACLVRGVSGLGLNPRGGSPRQRVLCRWGILAQDSFQIAPLVEATPAPRPGPGRHRADLPKAASRWPGFGTGPMWPGSARGTAPLEGCGVIPAASGNRSPPRRRIHGVGSVRAAAAGTADAPLGTAAVPGPAPAWAGVRTNQRQRRASGRRDRMMGGTRHANESRHKACGNIGRWNSSSRFFSDLCASLDDSCSVAW